MPDVPGPNAKTPRERLKELREAEAVAAKQAPTVGGLPIPVAPEDVDPPALADPPADLEFVPAREDSTTTPMTGIEAEAAKQALAGRMPELDPTHPWTVYCGDIVGGTFQFRDTIVQFDGEFVRAESAVHAQAIRDHLAKIRVDLGLTTPAGMLRRMPTLQDQRR